jgi:hypothetical protein
MKVKFQRPPNYFLYTDTTKAPGFAATFHEYPANYAIWKYCASKGMPIATVFKGMVDVAEQIEIPDFYLGREKDTIKQFYPKYKNTR